MAQQKVAGPIGFGERYIGSTKRTTAQTTESQLPPTPFHLFSANSAVESKKIASPALARQRGTLVLSDKIE